MKLRRPRRHPQPVQHHQSTIKRIAHPYRLYGADEIIPTFNGLRGIGTANGMISTVTDLAKYDVAIDRNVLVKKETQEQMWTATVSNSGKTLPYGFGWMVQNVGGTKVVWHAGYLPNVYSALYVKVPQKRLAFVILANSDALSAPARLGQGNLLDSAFGASFLRTFVSEDAVNAKLPAPDWGAEEKSFRATVERLEKGSKGYKYTAESADSSAIKTWLEGKRSEAHHAVKLDPRIYDAYVGQYQFGDNPPFTILNEGGRLMRQGRSKFELFPESETVFFAKAVDAQFIFVKDKDGKITDVKIRVGENEQVARRLDSKTATGSENPLKETLVNLEKQSWESWKNRDAKFFQNFLSDDHVEVGFGGPTNKAVVVNVVGSPACVVKSYSVDRFELTVFDTNAALLTYHAAQDTTCGGKAVPSPVWASSLYIKRGDKWLNAAYQQTPTDK